MKRLRITVGNKSYEVTVEDLSGDDGYPVPTGALPPQATTASPVSATPRAAAKPQLPTESGAVTSPMAGVILSLLVKPGDSVTRGQGMVVLEAMKMENQITAPVAGTVKSVDVAAGVSVVEGQVLVVLE